VEEKGNLEKGFHARGDWSRRILGNLCMSKERWGAEKMGMKGRAKRRGTFGGGALQG